jgi:protein subunit release factor B
MIKMFFLVFSGYIPVKELKLTYSTSSGPGGQNVNRVATKVDLRSATFTVGVEAML